jgi:hypothetical protein
MQSCGQKTVVFDRCWETSDHAADTLVVNSGVASSPQPKTFRKTRKSGMEPQRGLLFQELGIPGL